MERLKQQLTEREFADRLHEFGWMCQMRYVSCGGERVPARSRQGRGNPIEDRTEERMASVALGEERRPVEPCEGRRVQRVGARFREFVEERRRVGHELAPIGFG